MTTTDTTEAALLAGILANPEADLPRLVYCDWLEESAGEVECGTCKGVKRLNYGLADGDCFVCSGTGRVSDGRRERSEFIRVQIELATRYPRWSGMVGEDTLLRGGPYDALRRRERELLRHKQCCQWFDVPGLAVSWTATDGVSGYYTGSETLPVTVSRGFVSHVTASFETLFGGECEVCDGSGQFPRTDLRCPHCTNGRTNGIAADLFRNQPVESVTLAGKEPLISRGAGAYFGEQDPIDFWVWVRGTGNSSLSWEISDELWCDEFGGSYESPEAALLALSAAATKLGRQRAGV